ncbi:response regulator [Streptomyces sp. NPDC048564]|uniref:response regulator n=1 Tax=Streptomyces sp. NPDC048564 TaxID=3155760 RepID=UPI0034292AE9
MRRALGRRRSLSDAATVIKVLVAADLHVVRACLVSLLDEAFDVEVVAHVGSGDAVLAAALKRSPDVAVLDIGMPGLDGLAALLREHVPGHRPLLLTAMDSPDTCAAHWTPGSRGSC